MLQRNAPRNESPDPTPLTNSMAGGTAFQTAPSFRPIQPRSPSVTHTIVSPVPANVRASATVDSSLVMDLPASQVSSARFGFTIQGRLSSPFASGSPLVSSAVRIPDPADSTIRSAY